MTRVSSKAQKDSLSDFDLQNPVNANQEEQYLDAECEQVLVLSLVVAMPITSKSDSADRAIRN